MEHITIADILYAMITVILPLALKYFAEFVREKANGSKYEQAINSVTEAVIAVNQTYVDSLKADKSFTNEAQAEAMQKAKTLAIALMEKGTMEFIQNRCGDLNEWLRIMIEATVRETKN